MQFSERTIKDAFGSTVIQSKLGRPTSRRDFEKQLWPGVEVGLAGWQRAHSQGAGTGWESPYAIRYAPEEVNQQFQLHGIERYLRELLDHKPADVDLWLTTVTSTHPGTLRLKEIQYSLNAVRAGVSRLLFEASIEIADSRLQPRVTVQATPFVKLF
jgi:Bacterial toxin 4